MSPFMNGYIYECPKTSLQYIFQWLSGDMYGLLTVPYMSTTGMTAMMFFVDKDGKWQFTGQELTAKLKEGWIQVSKMVTVVDLEEVS